MFNQVIWCFQPCRKRCV